MILLADSDGPGQTAQQCRLIWAFTHHIYPKTHFDIAWPILYADGQGPDLGCPHMPGKHIFTWYAQIFLSILYYSFEMKMIIGDG